MKLNEINTIRQALVLLGEEKFPIVYEIAKNIKLCDKALDEAKIYGKQLTEKFADKNEDGSIKQYIENGQSLMKVTDSEDLEHLQHELSKIENEEHDIPFLIISKDLLKSPTISSALRFVPLIDTVIK
jgi:hypothetical protein